MEKDEGVAVAAVLGAGSWGTALAMHLARRGHEVRLWSRDAAHAAAMASTRRNPRYLARHVLPERIVPTHELASALASAHVVVAAVPSHAMRETMRQVAPLLAHRSSDAAPIHLAAAKGIEVEGLGTMHDVIEEELPASQRGRAAVLGGPSFADEVAEGLPTMVVVAAHDPSVRTEIQRVLSGDGMRAYETEDVLGVELGGTFKNVIALAAGVCDGAGLGQNARAGLITRGLAEIARLAMALGANPATISGLAGTGDLVLTCTGGLSRNRRVGMALGQGKTLAEILAEMGMVAEGIRNTKSAYRLAQREGVDMPIVEVMHAILYEDLAVPTAVEALMGRKLKAERG